MKLGNTIEERLPVLVTSSSIEDQLLGAPKLNDGTGEVQASAVKEMLDKWDIAESVQLDPIRKNQTSRFLFICMHIVRHSVVHCYLRYLCTTS